MGVFKEIEKADGSGVTTFYRLSDVHDTVETDDSEGTATVIDYNAAQNKPSVNGVALVGNKTSEDLGLQPAGDYITNDEADAKFIDEDELEAKNYVNETRLQEAIANIDHFHREIVNALPVTGQDNVLYMVRKQGSGEDIFNEYIWVGKTVSETGYEFIGTTATDLTDYYQKDEVDDLLDGKVDKVSGRGLSEQNYTLSEKTKLAGLHNYDDTELQVKVANLHNYDDTDLQLRVGDLEVKEEADSNAISTIQDALNKKMICIRLVEQGDGWTWMDINGSRLTFDRAQAYLGQENCMLFVEQLENDGKVIPAEYKSETTRIKVLFKDLDSLVHIMTLGEEDLLVEDVITTEDGACDFEVENEAVDFGAKLDEFYGNTSQEVIAAETGTEVVDKSISVNDVDTSKENYITLKGNVNQETTTGKNILPISHGKITCNGLTISIQDGIIELNGTSTAATSIKLTNGLESNSSGTVTASWLQESVVSDKVNKTMSFRYVGGSGSDSGCAFRVFNDTTSHLHQYYPTNVALQSTTYNATGPITCVTFYCNGGQSFNHKKFKMQLEEGTSSTDFEKYTYGIAPNMSYPEEIQVFKGYNLVTIENKNLLHITATPGVYNEITLEDVGNGYYRIYGATGEYPRSISLTPTLKPKLENGQTYTYSIKDVTGTFGGSFPIAVYNLDGITQYNYFSVSPGTRTQTRTISSILGVQDVTYYIGANVTCDFTFRLQIEKGAQSTAYVLPERHEYPITLPVKNLFDKNNINMLNAYFNSTTTVITSNDANRTIYIPCNANTYYTIRKTPSAQFCFGYTTVMPAAGVQVYGIETSASTLSDGDVYMTIKTGPDAKYIVGRIIQTAQDSTTKQQEIKNSLQIEEGRYPNTYCAYGVTPIELYRDSANTSSGLLQDKIYKKNGKWYLYKEVGVATFDGTENWSKSTGGSLTRFNLTLSDIYNYGVDGRHRDYLYCSHFKSSTIDAVGTMFHYKNQLFFYPTSDISTVALWQAWLANNNMKCIYKLATPTETEITNSVLISQLNTLHEAGLCSSITNMYTETNNLLPYIDLKYNVVTPAPSPERPSEIKVVKGNNNIKTIGKNRLNIPRIYTINGGGINVKSIIQDIKPGSYVLSCANVIKGGANYPSLRINNDFYRLNPNTNSDITIPDNVTSAYFYSNGTSYVDSVGVTSTVENLMISPNGGDYELYKSQTFPLSLGQIELCKLGNKTDKIYKQNDTWYLHKEVEKIILTGSEGWTSQSGAAGYNRYSYVIDSNYSAPSSASYGVNGKNNCFTQRVGQAHGEYEYLYLQKTTTGSLTCYIQIDGNRELSTTTKFKTWLNSHNTTVYYVLETSTDTEITDLTLLTQLENLQQITQYKHTYIDLIPDTNIEMPDAQFTYISNAVINASDRILGKDTYWNDEVPTSADLPSNAEEGEIRIVQDTQNVYIYDGYEWIPFDKGGEVDLSNYLAKDNTTAWVPTGAFNPATKKYVDDSVGGVFVPTKTSQLTNDSNFIGKNSNDLTYYYTKTQTYTKSEVDALIGGGGGGGNVSITVSGDTLVITTE